MRLSRSTVRVRLATRGSPLALWQARHIAAELKAVHSCLDFELTIVRTTGDRLGERPLARGGEIGEIGEIGWFTREIDRAVLEHRADAAVHSLKDLPTEENPALTLAAVLEREDPRDAFVPAPGVADRLDDVQPGLRVGTSSMRRRALLFAHRLDLVVEDFRGNLDTRLERLRQHDCDAAILALAGLRRLGRESVVGQILDPPAWLPAAGQGALAVVVRADDVDLRDLVGRLDHPDTRTAVTAERALLRFLGGGCQVPIGALAQVSGPRITLHAFVGSPDGQRHVRAGRTGPITDPVGLGAELAQELVAIGASPIIDQLRRAAAAPQASAP